MYLLSKLKQMFETEISPTFHRTIIWPPAEALQISIIKLYNFIMFYIFKIPFLPSWFYLVI